MTQLIYTVHEATLSGDRGDNGLPCNWEPGKDAPNYWGPCSSACWCWDTYDVGGFFGAVAIAGALQQARHDGFRAGRKTGQIEGFATAKRGGRLDESQW